MKRNTRYIQALDYDLQKLLAVDLAPTALPVPDHTLKSHKRILCTKTHQNTSRILTDNALLNPSAGVVFPGAIVKQDRTLAEGQPTPYTFPRGPLTIRVSLPGLGEKGVVTVDAPSAISVNKQIDMVVEYWFDNVNKEGYKPPTRAFSSSRKSYTKEQIGIDLGFGAQWGRSATTASMRTESNHEATFVYRAFKQIYYTVYVQEPEEAGDVFVDNVVLNTTNMPATQPPGLVRSVDYGRIIIVQMTTDSTINDVKAEASLNYVTGSKIEAKLAVECKQIIANSSFQALALGGGSETAQLLATGDPEKIAEAITNGIEFSKSNPAYPVSYIVADLKSREVSQIRTTTDYIQTACRVMPEEFRIRLKNEGWYDANLFLAWDQPEYDADGNRTGRTHQGGYRPFHRVHKGESTDVWVPSDAEHIRFTGQARSDGKSQEKTEHFDVLDGNKQITVGGTLGSMTVKVISAAADETRL